jgi:hypothetical protein
MYTPFDTTKYRLDIVIIVYQQNVKLYKPVEFIQLIFKRYICDIKHKFDSYG